MSLPSDQQPAVLTVSLMLEPSDPVATAAPVGWAVGRLEAALATHGVAVVRPADLNAAGPGRGLQFQLGLWAQVYELEESPNVNHPIEGLTPENHAAY